MKNFLKLVYPAIIAFENGKYKAYLPDISDCAVETTDLADAVSGLTEAANASIFKGMQKGNPAPKASDITRLEIRDCERSVLIMLDLETYSEKHSGKAVRKNVTIPAWLNTYAEKKHLNFSWLLQNELMKYWKQDQH